MCSHYSLLFLGFELKILNFCSKKYIVILPWPKWFKHTWFSNYNLPTRKYELSRMTWMNQKISAGIMFFFIIIGILGKCL